MNNEMILGAKNIVLLSGSHLSSNPRLVKEALALITAGYSVDIICTQNLKYLKDFDLEIIESLKGAKIHIVDYSNHKISGIYLRIMSALRVKVKKALGKFMPIINDWEWLEINRIFPEMKSILKNIKADLYIAHTPAALPLAAWAAEFHSSKFVFDAEDYHRAETDNPKQVILFKKLEDKFLNQAVYISTASPFITKEYSKLYPQKELITINNVFPYQAQTLNKNKLPKPLKLVWFSQTIGLNRGIQELIYELNRLNSDNFELHLRGTCDENTKTTLFNSANKNWQNNIFFYPQCSPTNLQKWLCEFDIGLSLEHKTPYNRDICITNKIFQYITAGLAIIATNTKGQEWVINQAPEIGFIMEHDNINRTLNILNNWIDKPADLISAKQAANNAAKNLFNWDIEKNKFLSIVSST